MPIIDIEVVEDAGGDDNHGQALEARLPPLTDRLGELFASEPGGTWARLKYLPREHYAENRTTLDPAVRPTFVTVLKGALPATDALRREAREVASIVADVLDRPRANVHVLYSPAAAGRIAFGGELVEP